MLKVNLIYDYRQQATNKLSSLGLVVEDNRASYDELKAKLTTLKAEYDAEKTIFNQKLAVYKEQKPSYGEAKELEDMQNQINNLVDEINALVVVLNQLVAKLNLSVDKYNAVGASRGESFEEGMYSTDGWNREIDIYEFSDRDKLVRVLAHELGHALGLDHVKDPKAIMYELNQSSNEILTKADLDALKEKCNLNK